AKTQSLTGLNSSGPAPRALSPEFLASHGHQTMPMAGIHAVTVPGAVAGWSKMHERFGKAKWSSLFEASIAYAEERFPVTEAMAEQWDAPQSYERMAVHAPSARLFHPEGMPYKEGDVFVNRELGNAYRALAQHGPREFYEGGIAESILSTSRDLGGTMTR